MIEPETVNPFVTREVYAQERNVFPILRNIFPSPQLFTQLESPIPPIPIGDDEDGDD